MNEEEELRDVERVKKDTERLRKLKNRELRILVESFYDMQKLRIAMGGRIYAYSKAGLLEYIDPGPALAKLKEAEKELEKEIKEVVVKHPLWDAWFKDVKGIGPIMAAGIIAWRDDISKSDTVSAFWKYHGLAPGQGRQKGKKLDYNPKAKTHCYSEDTTILTREGFKNFEDITKDSEIATLNIETEELEYQKPTELIKEEYKGKMIHFSGQSYDFLVTPNHKMLVRKYRGSDSAWKLVVADDILQGAPTKYLEKYREAMKLHAEEGLSDYKIAERLGLPTTTVNKWIYSGQRPKRSLHHAELLFKRDMKWKGTERKEDFILPEATKIVANQFAKKAVILPERRIKIDLWLEFFAWWIAEGSTFETGVNNYVVSISNSSMDVLQRLAQIIEDMGYSPCICEPKAHENRFGISGFVAFHNKQMHKYLSQFGHSSERYLPLWLKNLSKPQLQSFLITLIAADGSDYTERYEDRSYKTYVTKSKQLRDDVTEIGLKCGYGVTILSRDVYQITFSSSKTPMLCKAPQEIDYNGKIYCVTVPNHVVLVQRNGKIGWSGNSWKAGIQLLKAKGQYADLYYAAKSKYESREDIKQLHESGNAKGGMKSYKLHLHYMALRKMIKRFLVDTWVVWRSVEGLSVTEPYIFGETAKQKGIAHEHYKPPKTDKELEAEKELNRLKKEYE